MPPHQGVYIKRLSVEHHHNAFGIFHRQPRLSWSFGATAVKGWQQTHYDIVISRNGTDESYHVRSSQSVLVSWPSSPLSSREIFQIRVRATGTGGLATDWSSLTAEVALLEGADWKGNLISGPQQAVDKPKRPIRFRKVFTVEQVGRARLYATAHGVYNVEINGQRVGDQVLAPGWQSYKHRLHYQTYDLSHLLRIGDNCIGICLGEGWFAGRLGRPGISNIWGDRLGFLGQLEIDQVPICVTDGTWEYSDGPIIASEIYNGEIFDSTLSDPLWSTTSAKPSTETRGHAEELRFPEASLISPDVAPVRRILEIKAQELITTPSGKKILDFGQNLVGWLRIDIDIPGKVGDEVLIRHAEVLEHGELGTRPLRTAEAREIIKLGGKTKGYEPSFTFHGFRYAEITGYNPVQASDFTAVVISSDLRRTGEFDSSHVAINKLHENTVWSMKGNFVSVPSDCPQRDERLGWTGDIQVFAPTASFLFDTSGFLGAWLRDLEADQRDANGVPPVIIPAIPLPRGHEKRPMALWADCCILTPWDLFIASGDRNILETQFESMCLWIDEGLPRDASGFYSTNIPQYGDWLDPRSPPARPGHCPTDSFLVANAYLVHVTELLGKIAELIGKTVLAAKYSAQAARLLEAFRDEYITSNGRLVSDTQTAYALALHFGLFESNQASKAAERLSWLTRWEAFHITTGFAGTPLILKVLADSGNLNIAYRMLQEKDEPSWLYPVEMGATTVWERWNSMVPDGTINPGQMTSFNHYALGSVCAFLHEVVGGLSAASPGWKTALVRPRPGGTLRYATTEFDSPYGTYSVHWVCEGSVMTTTVRVPPNGEARVLLDGIDAVVGSGEHVFRTKWSPDPAWPPEPIPGPQVTEIPSGFIP